jgi:hypothetical protein
MKKHLTKDQAESILGLLLNKLLTDPTGFRSYLPEVAQELEQLPHPRKNNTLHSTLTGLERERLHKALLPLLCKENHSQEEVVQILEYCATLIQDGSLPSELDRQTSLGILHKVMGIPLSKIKKTTKITLGGGEEVKEVAFLYGVHLHLTWNDRLVAISISPTKVKERSRALKFVGIAKDSASDVAEYHDAYFTKAVSNAVV